MLQRIKLSESSVIHNNPSQSKILSREHKINSTSEENSFKKLSFSVSVLQIGNSGINYHKYLGPYTNLAFYCCY